MLIKIKYWLSNDHWGYSINNWGNCDSSGDVVSITDRFSTMITTAPQVPPVAWMMTENRKYFVQ